MRFTMGKQQKESISDKCKRLENELKTLSDENTKLREKIVTLRKQKLKLDEENIDIKEKLAELKRQKEVSYINMLEQDNARKKKKSSD